MAYEIVVSATNFTVDSNTTELAVTINAPATPTFTITNAVQSIDLTTQQTTATIYTDAIELVLGDLNTFWRGQWTTGTYTRGDIVDYQHSQYFLDDFSPNVLDVYTSTIVPPNDATWIRFNWHEAPFALLTVTNSAVIGQNLSVGNNLNVGGDVSIGGGAGGGGLTINSTATFNGNTRFNSTASFYGDFKFLNTLSNFTLANLTVTNQLFVDEKFLINGLLYPKDKGLFGQVLYTNGADKADWVNLGDLVFWSLSADLYTNGFNIRTNSNSSDLKIGVSTNTNFVNSPAYTEYNSNGSIIHRAASVSFGTANMDFSVPTAKSINLAATTTASITGAKFLNLIAASGTATLESHALSMNQSIRDDLRGGTYFNANEIWYPYPKDPIHPGYGPSYYFSRQKVTLFVTTDTNWKSWYYSSWPGNVTDIQITENTLDAHARGNIGIESYNGNIDLTTPNNITLGGDQIYLDGPLHFSDGSVQSTAAISYVNINGGTGINVTGNNENLTISLQKATGSTLGGVKVPPDSGLNVDNGGNLTLTFGTQTGVYSIFAGAGISVSANTGSVTITNTRTYPTPESYYFQAGTGTSVIQDSSFPYRTTTTYYINPATTSSLGGIKVGNNLTVDSNGVLSAIALNTSTVLIASEDIVTNGYYIKLTSTNITTSLLLNSDITRLQNSGNIEFNTDLLRSYSPRLHFIGTGWSVTATQTAFTITAATINLAATTSTLGTDSNNSTLRVQRIYNYAGNYAPFFPAGVQFQDNTVQFTAYQPDLGLL